MDKNVWKLAACQSLMMTNNALLVTTSALVGYALASNTGLATLPLALQFMSTMLASIPASFIMARIGRRSGFLIGSLIGIIGGLIASYAITRSSFLLFCLGTIMMGTFNGFGNYYRFAAVDIVSSSLKGRAISYVMAGGIVAALLGPNIASWTHDTAATAPFASSYLVATGLYILTVVILLFTRIPHVKPEPKSAGSTAMIEILKRPVYFVAVLSATFSYSVMSLVMTATPLSMSHHHHDISDTAFVIQWHVLGMFAPSFLTGYLVSRYGVMNVMLAGVVLLFIAVAVNLLGISIWHYWLALLALGVGWNFLFIGATDLLTYTYSENEKAKAQAFNDFTVFSIVALSALTAGYLQNTFGWRVVNLGVLPMIFCIFFAVIWMKQKDNTTGFETRKNTFEESIKEN